MNTQRILKFRVWDNLKEHWVSNRDIWRIRTNDNGIGEIAPPAIHWKQHPQGLTIQLAIDCSQSETKTFLG